MTDPAPHPTEDDMLAARKAERTVAQQYEVAAGQATRAVRRVAGEEARKVSRRWGLIAALFAVLLSLGVSVAAYGTAASATALATSTKQTVDTALGRLGDANRALTARGQEPVPTPPDATPAEAIQSAVLAQVLASLPASPTPADVASRIQGAVVAQILGPTQDQLSTLVANYFAAHPPQPGPAPSDAQIRAAVDASLAANPPASGRDGSNGQPGKDGQNGTNGVDGKDGVSVTDQRFVRLPDLACISRVTYSDGTSRDDPAGDAACPTIPGGEPADIPSAFTSLLPDLISALWRSV